MAFKPSKLYARKKGKKMMMKTYIKSKLFRSVYPNTRYTASETFNYGVIQFGSSQLTASYALSVNMNQCPQAPLYAQLFRQFCIRHVSYKIVPRFGDSDMNALQYNITASTPSLSNIRLHSAVVDTPFVGAPGSEGAILANNNCRTRMLNTKIFKISQANPKPETTVSFNGTTQTNNTQVKDQWFNFTDPTGSSGTTQGGQNVPHGNVQLYAISSGSNPNGFIVADIYCKITFSCRNPA